MNVSEIMKGEDSMANVIIIGIGTGACYLLHSRMKEVQLNNRKRIRRSMRNSNKRKR